MSTANVVSASRAGVGSVVTTPKVNGTFNVANVGVVVEIGAAVVSSGKKASVRVMA